MITERASSERREEGEQRVRIVGEKTVRKQKRGGEQKSSSGHRDCEILQKPAWTEP